MDLKNKAYLQLANLLVEEFYKKQSAGLLSNLNKRNVDELSVSREKILKDIREQLGEYQSEGGAAITEEEKDMVMELIDRELWGYGIIDPFIHEANISDIKIYGAKRVMGKEVGQRIPLPVEFDSEKVYLKFVSKLLERNKINLGTANAIQTFTDTSLDDFILRMTDNTAAVEYVSIDFPFELSEVNNVEMFRYNGAPVNAEKKNVTESKDIKNLYVTFSELQLQNRKPDITAVGSSVTSFRFNLSDGTNYELIYVGYGVKDGELFSGTDNFRYFTSADIGWYWKWLNESYEAMPASVEELPTYSNMPQSTLKQPAIEEADNN